MRNDPKVIAAYLGVEDEEEVEQVEAELRAMSERAADAAPATAIKSFYGKIMALKGVDIDVHEGEIVTLIGANGAGKSTLMMTIFGDPRAREGRIVVRGPRHHRHADPRDRAPARSPSRPRGGASSRA